MNILDVDFRYAMRDVQFRDQYDPQIFTKKVKVLQWRKNMLKHEFGGLRLEEWTEWEDVRTEDE